MHQVRCFTVWLNGKQTSVRGNRTNTEKNPRGISASSLRGCVGKFSHNAGKWYVLVALSEMFARRRQQQFRKRGCVSTDRPNRTMETWIRLLQRWKPISTATRPIPVKVRQLFYHLLCVVDYYSMIPSHWVLMACGGRTLTGVQRTLVVLHLSNLAGLHKYLVIIKNSSKRQIMSRRVGTYQERQQNILKVFPFEKEKNGCVPMERLMPGLFTVLIG